MYAVFIQYYHNTDEINAQLGLSEHLLNDIAGIIGRKSLKVSKLAIKVFLYVVVCLKVSSLTDSTETLLSTSEQQHQELQVYVYHIVRSHLLA